MYMEAYLKTFCLTFEETDQEHFIFLVLKEQSFQIGDAKDDDEAHHHHTEKPHELDQSFFRVKRQKL